MSKFLRFSMVIDNTDAVGLIQLGQEPIDAIRLEDFLSHIVLLGAGEGCHIQVDHMHVSARHLAFIRQGMSWTITICPKAKNTTYLNGIPLRHGLELNLPAGAVIRVGHAAWVTIDAEFKPGIWRIAACSQDEFYTAALFTYGSARKAARVLGVDQRTYLRAIHKIPEADAFLRKKIEGDNKRYRSPFGVPILPVSRNNW
jgi:hypothetical protein